MEGKSLWENLHLRVGPRSLLLSVLPWAPHWFLCLPYPIPAGRGTTLQCDTWVQVFLPWHNTAAAVINITWCGPYHLGSNGLFLNAFIMTHWPGTIVCPPSGGVCQHDSTLSLALCTAFVRFSQLAIRASEAMCTSAFLRSITPGICIGRPVIISWGLSPNDLLGDALILHSTAGSASTHGTPSWCILLSLVLIVLFDRSTCPDACGL